jgi:hypothetical protein
MVRRSLLLLCLLPAAAGADPLRHFALEATFVPAKKAAAKAAVAVSFRALDPDLRLNESPAPRLKLDLSQTVLVDEQPPAASAPPSEDPLAARYHDLSRPLLFPVSISPLAPAGEHVVKASVIFFYCSQREAWCRRGSAEIELGVQVR